MDFSPADSLLSAPDGTFVSLFGDDDDVMSPTDSILTPPRSVSGSNAASNSSRNSTQEPEKKPPKKRKSWGQELPTPTTNLPPRKRAKTEAEKEQRRIERVLRNRAAAQSSRERKRKEVEALEDEKGEIERENRRLNNRILEVEQQNLQLSRQIAEMAAKMTVFQQQLSGGLATPDSSTRSIVSPISQADSTFGAESIKLEYDQDLDFSLPPPHSTLDPNALLSSPSEASIDDPTATTLDLTQHPAEMLCDQQCQLRVTRLQWGQTMELSDEQSRHMAFLTLVATLTQLLFLTMSSTVFSLLHRPLHQIFSSLRTGNPLSITSTTSMTTEAYSISRLILWLTSTPLNHPSATTTLSSNQSRENQRATFRIRLLERLLACSPALARPLKDATASALQLVSDSIAESRDGRAEVDSLAARREMASLMTMLWAIESIKDPQRKCRSDPLSERRDDPAGDIRRLCIALDGLSNGDTGGGKASKNHDELGDGHGSESLTTRRLTCLNLAISALAGKHGTGV